MEGASLSTEVPQMLNSSTRVTDTLRSFPESSVCVSQTVSMNRPKQSSALQQLSELLGQNLKLQGLADFKELLRVIVPNFHRNIPTIPVNDLRGEEASAYSREECVLRRSLAALYRLIDIRGWTHSIYNHISARSTDSPQQFLINPFGLLYHEIQASSLVKIDDEGNIVHQGSTVLGVNKAGWTLHSALYGARKDVNCITHIHLPDVIAVSCMRAGLLPVSPEANELLTNSGVCFHDYHGILVDETERSSIQSDLGPKAKILFLRNHGVAIAASSVPEAWYLLKRVVAACQTQMRMLQLMGGTNLLAELKETGTQLLNGAEVHTPPGVHRENGELEDRQKDHSLVNGKTHSDNAESSWSPEDLEFEAEMRVLDSAGFRTGHIYRQPNLLRHVQPGSTWGGDTMGDQMTGAELMTTDFSATEFSAADDIAAAEAAGAQQRARIADHVRANRQRSLQRNQWLSKTKEFDTSGTAGSGVVTSSLLVSPVSTTSGSVLPTVPQPFRPPESPLTTPVKRPGSTDANNSTSASRTISSPISYDIRRVPPDSTPNSQVVFPVNGYARPSSVEPTTPPPEKEITTHMMKSATLPANVQRLEINEKAHLTNTLQSTGSAVHSGDEEVKLVFAVFA
ncbi:unnamed protein product [Calicophoron daubneyi]|uniref:Class II aldolase/adducin N-terminal domain-containing protein n=1 Tax=Calicophoron daubneyi TaxID=300641 RepID=A0AAV2TB21_CALDB